MHDNYPAAENSGRKKRYLKIFYTAIGVLLDYLIFRGSRRLYFVQSFKYIEYFFMASFLLYGF
jgi:hypothetical protein